MHVIPSPLYRGLHWHVLFSVQTALTEQLGEHAGGTAAGREGRTAGIKELWYHNALDTCRRRTLHTSLANWKTCKNVIF